MERSIEKHKLIFGYRRKKLMEGFALIGHTLHFTLSDILSLEFNEFVEYYEIAVKLNKV